MAEDRIEAAMNQLPGLTRAELQGIVACFFLTDPVAAAVAVESAMAVCRG